MTGTPTTAGTYHVTVTLTDAAGATATALADRLGLALDLVRQQLLDVPQAECDPEIEPDRIADHVRREPVALERERSNQHEPPTPA